MLAVKVWVYQLRVRCKLPLFKQEKPLMITARSFVVKGWQFCNGGLTICTTVWSFEKKTYTWWSRKGSYFWFTQWEYPDKAKEKHMKSAWKAYEKCMKSVWKVPLFTTKDHLQGIVTLCFYSVLSTPQNVHHKIIRMRWCMVPEMVQINCTRRHFCGKF